MDLNNTTCCGLRELHTFSRNATAETVNAFIKAAPLINRGALFATLNEEQVEAGLGKVLEAANFIKIDTFYNPNTGHQVSFFYRRINQPSSQPKQLIPRPLLKKCACYDERLKKALRA